MNRKLGWLLIIGAFALFFGSYVVYSANLQITHFLYCPPRTLDCGMKAGFIPPGYLVSFIAGIIVMAVGISLILISLLKARRAKK